MPENSFRPCARIYGLFLPIPCIKIFHVRA
jgi:hypothetical protein